MVTLPGEAFTPDVGNSGTVSNQMAGHGAFNLTLYAVRAGDTVLDTNYSGTKTITYSGPATAPGGTAPSYTTNVTFINGVATNIATTLDRSRDDHDHGIGHGWNGDGRGQFELDRRCGSD